MKSQYGQKFNHDPVASWYDEDVKNENHPIRAGYSALLNWMGDKAGKSSCIVDLGCGTGNTTVSVESFERAYCVDVSQNMLDIAKEKLARKKGITFVRSDLLHFFEIVQDSEIDTVISSYAIHHLTQPEKHELFREISNRLKPGEKIILGDLMFENRAEEQRLREKYPELIQEFDDEFFWCLEEDVLALKKMGFSIEVQRFSDLSWGISGTK